MSSGSPRLARRLGLGDAVFIGLGAMVGAGVFSAFGPAARAAGSGLLIGLAIAAVIAFCNAVASAQLAAAYPTSGGTYIYGRERLGHWWGFVAGWAFIAGKTASCAAMALTFASYAVPDSWWVQRAAAFAAVVALTALNYRGITRTATLTRILVGVVLLVLVSFVVVALSFGQVSIDRIAGGGALFHAGGYATLQAAGLLFFAFAGYARIATLAEEVRDPERTIPRAISLALAVTVAIYALIAITLLVTAGPDRLAASTTPLITAAQQAGAGALAPLVRVGAALASLGALLALIAGIARTGLAMARHGDLPSWLAGVHPRYRVPHHAEIALAIIVGTLVLTTDLRGVIAFSSFGVLIYYAIANASAFTQPRDQRRWPRSLNVLGAGGCVVLAATLPWTAAVTAATVIAIGLAGRVIASSRQRRGAPVDKADPSGRDNTRNQDLPN
ncbi:MAG: APC family permease [Jatrophihabitans sp.]